MNEVSNVNEVSLKMAKEDLKKLKEFVEKNKRMPDKNLDIEFYNAWENSMEKLIWNQYKMKEFQEIPIEFQEFVLECQKVKDRAKRLDGHDR